MSTVRCCFFIFYFGQLCKMPNKIFMLIAGLFEFIQWAIQLFLIPLHTHTHKIHSCSHHTKTVQSTDYCQLCIETCLVFYTVHKIQSIQSGKILSSFCCCCCFFIDASQAFCFNNKTMHKEENLFSFFSLTELFTVLVDKFITLPVTKYINI